MAELDDTTPRYRCLEDTFFAPQYVDKGSIVRTWLEPGPHLEPINEAARQAMERFYTKEFSFKVRDPAGGEDMIKTCRPREDIRTEASFAQDVDTRFEVLEGPPVETVGSLTIAELSLKRNTDMRPAPAKPLQPVTGRWAEEAPIVSDTEAGAVALVKMAPPDPTDIKSGIKTNRSA